METIWDAVKRFGILATRDKFCFSLPDAHALLAANRLHKMLFWIEAEFQADCKQNPHILKEQADGQEDFIVRNMSRTISYVNNVCLLEGILRRGYELLITSLQAIDPSITSDEAKLSVRVNEIEEIKRFRNKIAAHTVFAQPKPDDNIAQELTSLISLITTTFEDTSTTFRLGEIMPTVNGLRPKYTPQASINEMHPKVLDHFKEWICMYEEACLLVRSKLPKIVDNTTYYTNN
jgi:hypothetical protein